MDKRTSQRLAALGLSAFVALGAAGCGNRGEGNNANNNNANRAAINTNTGTTTANSANTTASPAQNDTALENTVKANLTKAGLSAVEVEVEDGVVTLKGNVARAKMADAMKAANDAGPKRVLNQLNAQ